MNDIGSKFSLLDFLKTSINKTLEANGETLTPEQMTFVDPLAGTGVVGTTFAKDGYNVIASDIQYYSFVLNKHYLENGGKLDKNRCDALIAELNALDGKEGFIYKKCMMNKPYKLSFLLNLGSYLIGKIIYLKGVLV